MDAYFEDEIKASGGVMRYFYLFISFNFEKNMFSETLQHFFIVLKSLILAQNQSSVNVALQCNGK